MIVAYEWFKLATGRRAAVRHAGEVAAGGASSSCSPSSPILERELEKVEFFRPPDKRDTMQINLRNIFTRMEPTQQDIQTLHGVIMAIAEGRKGPARGGVLDGDEAALLRTLLAEHGEGRVPNERGPVRGLARLLRRNPTEAERIFWDALMQRPPLRRPRLQAAGAGRAAHHRLGVVPAAGGDRACAGGRGAAAAAARAERRACLTERGYRVVGLWRWSRCRGGCRRRCSDGLAEAGVRVNPSAP